MESTQDRYGFAEDRYRKMRYRRCGRSGLLLPEIALGGWQNFLDPDGVRALFVTAFDHGITHFDVANNYGTPPGNAEELLGGVLKEFAAYRDELVVATKAGWTKWPGPYGDWASRKHLIASMDQSLKRLGQEYVDIFYSHRHDPHTPLEETMGALAHFVRQGKALYVGISNYDARATVEAARIMEELGVPLLVNQAHYSIVKRDAVEPLLPHAHRLGVGVVTYGVLAGGLLTDRYFEGIPGNSRAVRERNFGQRITPEAVERARNLNEVAKARGQTLAQMALTWVLRDERVTAAVIGASSPDQIKANVAALNASPFTKEELDRIDEIVDGMRS